MPYFPDCWMWFSGKSWYVEWLAGGWWCFSVFLWEQILLREQEGGCRWNVGAWNPNSWTWGGKRLRCMERAGAFLASFSEQEGKVRVSNYWAKEVTFHDIYSAQLPDYFHPVRICSCQVLHTALNAFDLLPSSDCSSLIQIKNSVFISLQW